MMDVPSNILLLQKEQEIHLGKYIQPLLSLFFGRITFKGGKKRLQPYTPRLTFESIISFQGVSSLKCKAASLWVSLSETL